MHIVAGRENYRRQASERLLFNRNNQNKVSKGENSVQNKQGIWCLRHAAWFVKEGQYSERKGSEEGAESGSRTRSPLRSGGRGGRRLRPPGPRRSAGINSPASWPSAIPVILVNYNKPMKDCLIYHLRTWHSEQHNEFSYPNWITETLFSVSVFSYTKTLMLVLLFQNGKTSLKVRVIILRKTANRCKNSCG